jgi:hypothetical protein
MCQTAPALLTFRNEANALNPKRSKASDGSCPSAAHHAQNPSSDHEANAQGYSRAYDLDEKLGLPGLDPDKPLLPLVPILLADKRTKYVIYERRIYYPDGTSKVYTGVNAHDHHLHLSIKNEYVMDTSPWNIARAFTPQEQEDEDMAATPTHFICIEDGPTSNDRIVLVDLASRRVTHIGSLEDVTELAKVYPKIGKVSAYTIAGLTTKAG